MRQNGRCKTCGEYRPLMWDRNCTECHMKTIPDKPWMTQIE